MLTRRKVLAGTAAASIAAIASAHGVAPAEAQLDCGFGDLQDGALARFDKHRGVVGVFAKFEDTAAELFYKEDGFGNLEVFFKTFHKGWTPVDSAFLKFAKGLEGGEAYFLKVTAFEATFFLKGENGVKVLTSISSSVEGIDLSFAELPPPSD